MVHHRRNAAWQLVRWLPGVLLVVAALTVTAVPAQAAITGLHGTYTTPLTSGTISYRPARAIQYGSEGTFQIDGQRRPGSVYSAVGGGTGMVWYYGTTGIMAGNALVTLQPDGTWSGTIWFFARSGRVTDTGNVTVTFP